MNESNRYPTSDELQRTYAWRRFWGIMAIASGGLLLFLFFALPVFLHNFLLESPKFTRTAYAALIVLVIVLIYVLHKWSIHVVSRLYLQVRHDRKSPNEDLLGNEPCHYCGAEHAPIVCGRCNSIQWPGLNHRATGIADTKTLWAAGVFIAHHRFKLLAAVLSALLLGVFPFIYRLEQERVVREQNLLGGLNEALPDLTSFRASLLYMASHCGRMSSNELAGNDSTHCSEQFLLFFEHYFKFSWRGPQIIAQVRNEHCRGTFDTDPHEGGISGASSKRVRDIQDQACRLLHGNLVDDLDELFIKYLSEHGASFTTGGEEQGSQICKRRIEAAQDLYHSGKQVSCAIVLAAAPHFGKNLSSHQGCIRELNNAFSEKADKSAVPQAEDEGDKEDLLKDSWANWMADCET